MEFNSTELEEGEACYYKGDDEDNIDIDSLSYIDERIQLLLGHFQKDFDGGVSAENLGSKFGGYGSFLPTYERSPCSRSHPKTPQTNHNSPNSPVNLHKEAVPPNRKSLSNMHPSARIGNASHSSHLVHDLREASVDDSLKKDTGISSNDVVKRCTLKDDATIKTGNSTDKRSLKFRLKMKPNILPQKNAEIYSGLGLDDSTSSSMENSPVESEGTPLVSKEKAKDSRTDTIQAMCSFTISGSALMSPLHERFVFLMENKKAIGDRRYISSLNGHQEPCSMSTDESGSFVGDRHPKKRTVRIVRQSEKLLEKNHMNSTLSESDMTLQTKKRLGNRTPDRKDFLSNDLRWTPLSSSICDAGETAEVTAKASEVSKEVNENGVQDRRFSVEALNEESLESISGQDFNKIEKRNARNGFVKNVVEDKQEISQKDNSTDPKNNGKCNSDMISKKVERDAMKFKIDKMYETPPKVKVVSEGKNKSKGDQSPGKSETVTREDSFRVTNNAMATDKGSAGFGTTSRNKVIKTKSLKHNKVRDSTRDSLKEKNSERRVDDRPGNKAIQNANINNEKQVAFGVKVKERPSGNKVGNQLLAKPEPFIKHAPGSFPMSENNPAPEMIPSEVAEAPLPADNWVACDSCEKWRLLPTGITPDQLPEKWLCSMLDWLPGMNSCDISEDETTEALHAFYQIPVSEGQNNMQTHVTETGLGVNSSDALQFGLDHKESSSGVSLDRKNKKHLSKEKAMSGNDYDIPQLSYSAKISAQVSRKNRSLNDTDQHPADSNPMKKMSSKQSSRFSMVEEKHVSEEKEKKINGGDRKHIKLKRKMDADQYRSEPPKKSKTEYSYADKQLDPGMGLEKVVPNSRNGLPTKSDRKDLRKHDEYCLPEDVKDRSLVAVKKEGVRTQVSSGGGSLDVKNSCKNDGLTKKRKSNDCLDDVKHNGSYSLHGDKQYDEEGNVNKFRKENKSAISNKEAKSVPEGSGNKLSKGGASQICLPGSRDQMAVDSNVRCVDKDHQSRKHRKIIASHQALDGIDPSLRKDFGSGQLAFAATSSSSKVSGSHKARTNNFDDVKGSPVESVTSSPFKASNLDNRILAVREISMKGDATKGTTTSFSSKGSRRGADNREGQISVKLKEGRISYNAPLAIHKDNARVEEVKDKARVQAKTFKMKNHLLEDSVPVEVHGNRANVMHRDEKVNKGNQESELSGKKSDKKSSSYSMEKNRRSDSQVCTDNMKVLATENSYSKKPIAQQNPTQDVEEANKANPVYTELRDKKSKALSSALGEIKKETSTVPPYQKEDMSNVNPIHDGNNGFAPDQQLTVPSPMRTIASQNAIDTLEEATKLKDSADHYKNSGFDFESNVTYFEAGLKFMHGASLLESCHNEISKHGEMSQMQIYTTAAKLFKSCAHVYESLQERAAAALAYKCMQVAYMRVVYCKHSSANRDRHELQSTLQMVSQGDSPSSSASDLDNLNNQVAMDKATLPKGTNALVPGNQVISARTHPSLVRLLDFTQDMNFAMEASTKCQSAFTAATAIMDQAQNRDCITSIKRVIDFSFQDIEELVCLVRNALKAISRGGLRGARE